MAHNAFNNYYYNCPSLFPHITTAIYPSPSITTTPSNDNSLDCFFYSTLEDQALWHDIEAIQGLNYHQEEVAAIPTTTSSTSQVSPLDQNISFLDMLVSTSLPTCSADDNINGYTAAMIPSTTATTATTSENHHPSPASVASSAIPPLMQYTPESTTFEEFDFSTIVSTSTPLTTSMTLQEEQEKEKEATTTTISSLSSLAQTTTATATTSIASPPPSPNNLQQQCQIFTCPECPKQFKRQYNLKSHLWTHTRERPYVCGHDGCKWAFARPHDLKRHRLLHTGEKPHPCPHCDKRFGRRDALRRHWNTDPSCQKNSKK